MRRNQAARAEANPLRLPGGPLHAKPAARRVGQYRCGSVLTQPRARFCTPLCLEETDFERLHRRYPQADENLLRRLPEEFEVQFAGANGRSLEQLARLSQTLSNAVQLGPQTGLLAEDLDAEETRLRLYHDQVEPLRFDRSSEDLSTRNAIRTRVNQVFRSTGIWTRLERRVRIDEFTYAGDPMRLDYAYRRNGTQGFVQTLPLGRDPGQAKVLAFTADAIRAKLAKTEFLAVSEVEPRPQDNARHRFVTGLLKEHEIPVVPLARLAEWAPAHAAFAARSQWPLGSASNLPAEEERTATPDRWQPLLYSPAATESLFVPRFPAAASPAL